MAFLIIRGIHEIIQLFKLIQLFKEEIKDIKYINPEKRKTLYKELNTFLTQIIKERSHNFYK